MRQKCTRTSRKKAAFLFNNKNNKIAIKFYNGNQQMVSPPSQTLSFEQRLRGPCRTFDFNVNKPITTFSCSSGKPRRTSRIYQLGVDGTTLFFAVLIIVSLILAQSCEAAFSRAIVDDAFETVGTANYSNNYKLPSKVKYSSLNLSPRAGGGKLSSAKHDMEDFEEISAEHSLYQMLLGSDRYQKHVRPVRNHKKPITVRVGMCVMMIEELVERDQIMVMAACVKMIWVDEFLAWNPANYDNLTWMAVSSTSLWLPDIAIINSPEPYSLTRKITNVDLNYKGEIGYFPSGRLATRCNLQITYFPFDWQHCEVRFESWIYPSQFLEIELYPGDAVDLKEYYVNHQWTVTGYRILSEKADYDGKNFSSITFTFTLRRKSSFYFMYFIFPELLLALLQTLSHTLPVEHPGRMTMLTALFIGTSVTHAGIASHIPKSSDTMSLLQIYMAIMSINLVFALVITFVMLYSVLRYPNEEPCARAMLAAFFSIVWPSRIRPSSSPRRKSTSHPLTEKLTEKFHQEQQQLITLRNQQLQKQLPDDEFESSSPTTIKTRRRQPTASTDYQHHNGTSHQHHPPAPSSIYEALLASQQHSKTAEKIACFDNDRTSNPNSPGTGLPRDVSGGFALRGMSPHSSHGNFNDFDGASESPKKRPSQRSSGSDARSRTISDANNNNNNNGRHSGNFVLVSMNNDQGAPLQSTVVRSPSRHHHHQMINGDNDQEASYACSLSMASVDQEQEQEQFQMGGDGTSTPGAISLAVGGATTYYASQQRCIDASSPTSAISARQVIRGGVVIDQITGDPSSMTTTSPECPPPPAMNNTNSFVVTPGDNGPNNNISGPTRPSGVAFCLDNEQQAQLMRRRGTVAAVLTPSGGMRNSSTSGTSGLTNASGSNRSAGGQRQSGGDDDLKRRWLLYCVALDKSIMYANGIWNVTLPIALFWIVPALHEAMLSPQLDR